MTKLNYHQWLYRGQRPNRIAKILNSVWAGVFSLGLVPNAWVTLEVVGRKSGKIISLPLAMATVNGQHYLVSVLGDNVQWVQNVRAAGGNATLHIGGQQPVQLDEVSTDQRAPILKAYLRIAPGARPHIPVSKDAPITEFEKIAAAYPVFRVESINAVQPTP